MTVKVVQTYDGRLPVYNVVREVSTCEHCNHMADEVLGSFDTYEEADLFADTVILVEHNEN